MEELRAFTKADFLNTPDPFEVVYATREDPFVHAQMKAKYADLARSVGVRNFTSLYADYVKQQNMVGKTVYVGNPTDFEGQELELNAGEWTADDSGVYTYMGHEQVCACVHPIMPVMRLVNVDTGIEKIKLAYRKGKAWRSAVIDKKTIASNNSIVQLADLGIAVTSENSKYLVRYLHDIENENYDLIPEKNSVGRLGWIGDEGFSPYVENLEFDGMANFKLFFESVRENGSYEKWLEVAREARSNSVYARIILSASFASVLVGPLGLNPFILHLWGGTETGKTVALLLAASVWACPKMGQYIHTFNATNVGLEMSAGFVNSLPLILDELQIVSDKRKFDEDIYKLCEGVGKSRSNKSLGINRVQTWENCTITNGEMPITSITSGGGAVNRIIEIECAEKLFSNPKRVADTLKRNYGFAGHMFVAWLQEEGNIDQARDLYDAYYKMLSENDTTEKQAMSAAAILTADSLITTLIFKENQMLKPDEIAPFLQTKAAVSAHERSYEQLCEYVIQNRHRFKESNNYDAVWGKFNEAETMAYVVKREYDRICADEGFNGKALLSWMTRNGKAERSRDKLTKKARINGQPVEAVALNLPQELADEDIVEFDEQEIFDDLH